MCWRAVVSILVLVGSDWLCLLEQVLPTLPQSLEDQASQGVPKGGGR